MREEKDGLRLAILSRLARDDTGHCGAVEMKAFGQI
jgi:hypothetical protein